MNSNTLEFIPWKVFAVLILFVALAALGVAIAAIVKKGKETYVRGAKEEIDAGGFLQEKQFPCENKILNIQSIIGGHSSPTYKVPGGCLCTSDTIQAKLNTKEKNECSSLVNSGICGGICACGGKNYCKTQEGCKPIGGCDTNFNNCLDSLGCRNPETSEYGPCSCCPFDPDPEAPIYKCTSQPWKNN